MPKQTKQLLIKLGIGILILFIFFLYNSKISAEKNKIESEYYDKTNLKFSGVVKKIKPLTDYQHDYGVILVEPYHSNMDFYDPRDSLGRFLGVIKNSMVDLVFNQISQVQIGDSIDFNVQEYRVYRNGKLIRESLVGMPGNDTFNPFFEVRENIELW